MVTTYSFDFAGLSQVVAACYSPQHRATFANATRTTSDPLSSTFSNTHNGWVAGGGVEVLVAGDWSIKGEYQCADIGTKTNSFPIGSFDPAVKLTVSTVRVGLNKHF
jgi:opacity protein-like surface antigen